MDRRARAERPRKATALGNSLNARAPSAVSAGLAPRHWERCRPRSDSVQFSVQIEVLGFSMKKLLLVSGLFLCALTALVWVGLASAIPVVGVAELGSADLKGMDVEVKDSKIVEIKSLAPLRFSV